MKSNANRFMAVVFSLIKAAGDAEKYSRAIARGYGYDIKLERGAGYEPLCIEVIGPNRVSVAHYYKQNGDLMADPDVVFEFTDDGKSGIWRAVEYTQHDMGLYRYEESGLPDVEDFCNALWAHNLAEQGWLKVATERSEAA